MPDFTVREVNGLVERTEALRFIKQMAWQSHQSAPPPPPQIILAAYAEQTIIGTISLDFAPLSLERTWHFEPAQTPLPFRREEIVQYGRWMTRDAGVSMSLVYAAATLATTAHKQAILCEAKPAVVNRLLRVGIRLLPVPHARLDLRYIPEEGRPYYLTDPAPYLYMVSLSQVKLACLCRYPSLLHLNISLAA